MLVVLVYMCLLVVFVWLFICVGYLSLVVYMCMLVVFVW